MSGPIDLSGRWSGIYFYPVDPISNPDDALPATPFVADLIDESGQVTGMVVEPDNLYGDGAWTIASVLDGSHDETHLRFTKFSEAAEGYDEPIQYDGAISADGLSIEGRWSIPGCWSGTFRMDRRSGVGQPAAVEREEIIAI